MTIKDLDLKAPDTLKVWIANASAVLINIFDLVTPVLEFVGVLCATIYTVWKLIDFAKQQRKQRKND